MTTSPSQSPFPQPSPLDTPDMPARVRVLTADRLALLAIVAVTLATWIPRAWGPIDLRWDGSVHYILGTSIAQGHGYRLLNEPGDIAAVQYPPLLPAIVAAHQLVLGTSDPAVVGTWLRLTALLVFVAFGVVTLRFLRTFVPPAHALLGAATSVLCMNGWFLSDALYPEIGFAIATTLFLDCARRSRSTPQQVLTYVCAVLSYALRTAGIVAFAAWVADSLLRARWREAAVRAALAALPVLAWQSYVFAVEHSQAYVHPAYDYQRAPYLFYNVSYARNVVLRDPFTPEKGDVQILRRIVRNLTDVPVSLGETLVAPRNYFEMAFHGMLGDGPVIRPAIVWSVFGVLSLAGVALTFSGLLGLALRGETIVPIYLLAYLALLTVTPFPGQYLRYLMPVAPILALAALVILNAVFGPTRTLVAYLVPVLAIQVAVLVAAFMREYQPVSYVAASGQRVAHKLFFYDGDNREFDEAIDELQSRPGRDRVIVAAGTPHWIYLRTGLKAVMPPFEADAKREQELLDGVPVDYLIVGHDVISSERYTLPMLAAYPTRWTETYRTSGGRWHVYRRVEYDSSRRQPVP